MRLPGRPGHRDPRRGWARVGVGAAAALVGLAAVLWWQRGHGGTDRARIGPDTVVLLGDSLSEQGDWRRLLPGREVANRGHAGFTTGQLEPVAAEVAEARPAVVFVLTGTNDIRDGHPPEWTVDRLTRILDRFEAVAPGTTVVVQTLLPRADEVAAVAATNRAIADLVADRDVELLDLHPHFDDGSGSLRPDETTDGLHLSAAGYDRWAGLLEDRLRELGVEPVGP